MKSIIIFSAVAAMSFTSLPSEAQSVPPQRSIILSVGEGPYVFERNVSFTVSYRNGEQEPWVIPNPSESVNVGIRYRLPGSTKRQGGYGGHSFGSNICTTIKFPDGQERTAWDMPVVNKITIAPGQTNEFKIDLERGWTGNLKPGLWTVWIVDKNLKIESNRIEIPLVFTADSIAACLEVAADNKQTLYKRRKHAGWLQRIMPDLDLRWPSEDVHADKRLEMEPDIMKGLQSFKVFLNDPNNAGVVETAIQNINDDPDDNKKRQLQNDGSL
jgi:hypothetical protein